MKRTDDTEERDREPKRSRAEYAARHEADRQGYIGGRPWDAHDWFMHERRKCRRYTLT